MQALCMHPSNPLLELRLHMPVMSSSPPSGLAEHLQLLQTSCIGPKCAFLQPPTPTVSWPQFCLVGPCRSSLSRRPSSHQDSDPVGPRPPPSLFSRSNILGFFSSPQHTGCAYYLLRGVVRFPSLSLAGHTPRRYRGHPDPPLRPRPPPLSAVLNGARPAGPARP